MRRDDSFLYSGISSSSFGTPKQQPHRVRKTEEKEERRGKLKPAADVVFAEIKSEMESVMFIKNVDIANAKDEKLFMVEMMARQKYVEYLTRLQNKLDNILRESKKVKKEQTDD